MVQAKFKVSGGKPNINKIMKRYESVTYAFKESNDSLILSVKNVVSIPALNQIKRALGGKRNRSSQVEVIEFKKG